MSETTFLPLFHKCGKERMLFECVETIEMLTGLSPGESKEMAEKIMEKLGYLVFVGGVYYWKGREPFYVYDIGGVLYEQIPSWCCKNTNVQKREVYRVG